MRKLGFMDKEEEGGKQIKQFIHLNQVLLMTSQHPATVVLHLKLHPIGTVCLLSEAPYLLLFSITVVSLLSLCCSLGLLESLAPCLFFCS